MSRNLDLAEGTQSVSGTHTLNGGSFTTSDVFGVVIDLSNLAGGGTPDIVRLVIKMKALTGGTEQVVLDKAFTGGLLVELNFQSDPYASNYSISFQLIKVQGTTRNVDWRIFTL